MPGSRKRAESLRRLHPRLKPPLTGEVAERSDGRRGFLPLPASTGLREAAGRACPAPTAQQNERQGPHYVIFNARCTRYTMYLNNPAIRLNSTQT